MKTKFEKRREWMNEQYSKIVSGSSLSNKQKTKLMKKLWKQAKRKYK